MSEQQPQTTNIRGEPVDLDVLLDFANIDAEDVEAAAEWWDMHASPRWVGALDTEPIDDNAT